MSTNSQDQEIDLGQIGKGIKNFFNGIVNSIFDFIFFVKKKIVIIGLLFVIGVVLAFLLDPKIYNHEISVIPNFGSNEYLYKKIEQIDTKLREEDESFFKELGIKNPKDVIGIEIEAYPAIYNFINNKEQGNNFELIKLMAEDGDIDKIMQGEITSKNYYHHKISIKTKGKFKKEDFITPVLNYLNSNPYFEIQQKVYQKNLADKIALNDSLIKQIDNLIVLLSSNNSSGTISISEKNSIPELVEKKDRLILEKQYLLTNENIFDKIIKEESSIVNIRDYKPLLLNNKILFPIGLILLYLLFHSLLNVYKKQSARINS
ncbi:hypothetical protein [Flavobacterium sp.]|uniref:hypothetical protein n=1 Tax=Flavobacterium sp. TaxID=239 RepID=UPI0008C1862B|nr:hypothetical protein [Flavobacterium sp.]OGS60720.1 MAG: hypothetical protein A2X07_01280 [Flavobacteria bacterium GWF1_32_7]HBD26247.1 hypothetical protein [Flavobacterium sp.]